MKATNHKTEIEVTETKHVNIVDLELTNDEAEDIIDAVNDIGRFLDQVKSEGVRCDDLRGAMVTLLDLRVALIPVHEYTDD